MSLHAEVAVPARDRRRLERLCRYVARPALSSDRLEERPDGRLALRLKTRWRDGTTHILMERRELLDRLVPLIPPPRAHQVRYHGVLAPCSSVRDRIVPGQRLEVAASPPNEPSALSLAIAQAVPEAAGQIQATRGASASGSAADACGVPHATHRHVAIAVDGADRAPAAPATPEGRPRPRRLPWAELLQRVFEVDALRCPRCGAHMRLIAAIEDPTVARKILECLKLPARAPPLGRAAAGIRDLEQAEDDWLFDQSPAHDEP